MNGTQKINLLCKGVLKLTDEDIKEAQDMANEQSGYIHPLNGAKQAKLNSLGNYNIRVLEAVSNLKKVLESYLN